MRKQIKMTLLSSQKVVRRPFLELYVSSILNWFRKWFESAKSNGEQNFGAARDFMQLVIFLYKPRAMPLWLNLEDAKPGVKTPANCTNCTNCRTLGRQNATDSAEKVSPPFRRIE
jgi:hypothetical protein